jgi:hypothetical protein
MAPTYCRQCGMGRTLDVYSRHVNSQLISSSLMWFARLTAQSVTFQLCDVLEQTTLHSFKGTDWEASLWE